MRNDFAHTTARRQTQSAGQTPTKRRSTGRASGRLSLATLLVAGFLAALVPTDRALALGDPLLLMWCSAGKGETDRRVFQFTASFGTVIEIILTCKNDASVISAVGTDPSGEFIELDSDMDLSGYTIQSTEVVPMPEADASQAEKPLLEREHKAPRPASDDGLNKAKADATAILEFIQKRTSG